MILQCIIEVYQRDKKVFIPDFGAFIYSEFNDDVDFNDLLTFDDGRVVEAIQKAQTISEDEARNALNSYVYDVKQTLDAGKLHFMDGFGYLARDQGGAICLRKSDNADTNEDKDTSGSPEDTDQSFIPSGSSENDSSEASNPDIQSQFETKEPSDWSALLTDKETDVFLEEPANLLNYEGESFAYGASSKEKTASEHEEMLEFEYNEKGGKRTLKTAAWIIIPLLFLAAAAFYYFQFYNGSEVSEQHELPTTISEALLVTTPEQPESEKTSLNEEPKTSQTKEPTVQNLAKAASSNNALSITAEDEAKTYCLVLGSFKEEPNADRYQQRLQISGMAANKFKGRNGFYFVGMENIEGKSTAIKLLSDVKADNPNAWIINKERI